MTDSDWSTTARYRHRPTGRLLLVLQTNPGQAVWTVWIR